MPGSLTPIPSKLLVSDLCDLLETYLQPQQIKEVYRAYLFSAEAHNGQQRKTGEPYIFHPLTVAYILGQMHMDTETLCAALLHDVIEDTQITKNELAQEFGQPIAELVDGVSKLSSIHFQTREQAQAASFQKMILAMSRDIRVIIVKLADRLHNMRTLRVMKRDSQRRIARETLEIYAPIANRLGMNEMRVQLEELCFATLYPFRYKVLVNRAQQLRQKQSILVADIQNAIEQSLSKHQIEAQVEKRDKHYYSIYYQMRQKKGLSAQSRGKIFSQVTNSCGFRIIIANEDTCYRVLGIVHSLYKPLCERFKDYIAIPKINGYQSLHTRLFGPSGIFIEVQIRTHAMQNFSETGITAYSPIFSDKKATPMAHQRASEWVRDLLDMQKNVGDSLEFLEQVKTDLFPEEVYVFTPQGKILQLPKGATALDFAYAVHSDVGNRCYRVKMNNQYVLLGTPLMNGQTIEVITAEWVRPKPSWLNFAMTARAQTSIRHFLKNLRQEEAIYLGKEMLDKELEIYSLCVAQLTEKQRDCLIKTFKVENMEVLLAEIGLGNRMARVVAHQFDPTPDASIEPKSPVNGKPKPLMIRGTEGILVNFARCCRPIPGDEIVGFVSSGRGIIIHTVACRHVAQYRHQPEKLLTVEWEAELKKEFLVDIWVDVHDQPGVLAKVAGAITDMNSNIKGVSTNDTQDGVFSTLKFCITVQNRPHLAAIMRYLRRLESVTRIHRRKS